MNPAREERLNSSMFGAAGTPRGLGEDVVITPPDRGSFRVAARAIFTPAGFQAEGGTDSVELVNQVDQFAVRDDDAAAVQVLRNGAVVRRSNGDEYLVEGAGPVRAGRHVVNVTRALP